MAKNKIPAKETAKKKATKKDKVQARASKKNTKNKKGAKKKDPPHTGSLAANLHEGGRSEYLAHYVFSSFGSAHLVPRQEDHGLDLICTLTEKDGHRLWPVANYCVQIKSTESLWEFPAEKSVQWFARYPLPIFFCVVDKSKLSLKIFHTTPRFFIWTHRPDAQRLVLVPGESGDGHGAEWEHTGYDQDDEDTFPLSAPIAEFTISEILDEKKCTQIKTILANWVEMDQANIFRIQAGLPLYRTFSDYETNNPKIKGVSYGYRLSLSDEEVVLFKQKFAEQNKWLSWFLAENGDYQGALRSDLLLRYFDQINWLTDSGHAFHLYSRLKQHFEPDAKIRKRNFYAGLDGLSRRIDELTAEAIDEAHVAYNENEKQLAERKSEGEQDD